MNNLVNIKATGSSSSGCFEIKIEIKRNLAKRAYSFDFGNFWMKGQSMAGQANVKPTTGN
jgi:hypothetical protein